jgi:polyhydroxyalkanoate synthesis repressor PhaR
MALIKRYANRKLYHSEAAHYVTLEDIAALVRTGEDLRVVDHASGRDITTLVLMQVVFEQEKRLGEMLPRAVLTRLLQEGEETVSSLRSRLLAAFDPDRHLDEGIRRRVQRLVQRGEMAADEGARLVERLLAPTSQPELEPQLDPQLDSQMDPQAEIQTLLRQAAALEEELARLKAPLGPGSQQR